MLCRTMWEHRNAGMQRGCRLEVLVSAGGIRGAGAGGKTSRGLPSLQDARQEVYPVPVLG